MPLSMGLQDRHDMVTDAEAGMMADDEAWMMTDAGCDDDR